MRIYLDLTKNQSQEQSEFQVARAYDLGDIWIMNKYEIINAFDSIYSVVMHTTSFTATTSATTFSVCFVNTK